MNFYQNVKMKHNKSFTKKFFFRGFTLLEMILYIALLVLVTIPALSLAWIFINDQTKESQISTLLHSRVFIFETIGKYVKEAASLSAAESIFGVNPGKLVLNSDTGSKIIFDTYQKSVIIAGRNVIIEKLRIDVGTGAKEDITPDDITVSEFSFLNLSSSNAATIFLTLAIDSVNPSNMKMYESNKKATISFTIRQH